MARVIKTQKALTGVDFPLAAEWDAGYLPSPMSHPCVRISVRRESESEFRVFGLVKKADIDIFEFPITDFPCETCAKAFALSIIFGKGFAECVNHGITWSFGDLLDATKRILFALLDVDLAKVSAYSAHRFHEIALGLVERRYDWLKVVEFWKEACYRCREQSLDGIVAWWFSDVMMDILKRQREKESRW